MIVDAVHIEVHLSLNCAFLHPLVLVVHFRVCVAQGTVQLRDLDAENTLLLICASLQP